MQSSNYPKYIAWLKLMRFDKPVGIYLLLWPTLWGLWVAAGGIPAWPILVIFIAGTVLMRAAGCVVNDIADRNFDRHVARTKDRPLTTGQLSLHSAVLLVILLCAVAFVLVVFLNSFTVCLSLVGLIIACCYPLMKRCFKAPQLILGVAFAWGIPMAFAAVQTQLPMTCWWLFGIAVLFPLAYDTMYAMVDRADDEKIQLHSTAILFGHYDRLIIGLIQLIILINLLLFGWWQAYHYSFYLGIFAAGGLFIYQQKLIQYREPADCFKAFLNNHWVGLIIFIAFVLGVSC